VEQEKASQSPVFFFYVMVHIFIFLRHRWSVLKVKM